jgi:hypothetical protein
MSAGGAFVTAATGTTAATLSATGLATVGAVAGAVGGGLSAALNGGDLGDILRGAAIGGIQGAIAGGVLHGMGQAASLTATGVDDVAHVMGHGILGGSANVAMGGKFQDGFLAASAGASANYMKFARGDIVSRTVKASVVGGTATAIGGGKFANGAWTAAFQHLLNFELGRAIVQQQARSIRANIQKQYDKGVRDFTIGNDKIDILARAGLYWALDNRSTYENLSLKAFKNHIGSEYGDSVFVDKWADARFNVIGAGGMAPVGRFQASDINYYYFTLKTTIYTRNLNAGAGAGHAANLYWNIGEFLLGNDLGGGAVPLSQSLDQIPRTAPWIEYGSNIFQKHYKDN